MLRAWKIGQRVKANWNGKTLIGVVSSHPSDWTVYVQFQPCGAHFGCDPRTTRAYGNCDGWTDEEYRVEREKAYCVERAANVEAERTERYPNAPFSAYRAEGRV